MNLNKINEKNVVEFVHELFDYYKRVNYNSKNIVHINDDMSKRKGAGWYQYINHEHEIHINVSNILNLDAAVYKGYISKEEFYTLVAICVGHEYRHFLQGKYIKDGVKLDGYTKRDILNYETAIYIKWFFDKYYKLNKGFIKSELDADYFAIKSTLEFLKNNYPDIDAERVIVNTVNYYVYLSKQSGILPIVHNNCESIEDILATINYRIKSNLRVPDLNKTLQAEDPLSYNVQLYFGLDMRKLMMESLADEYRHIKSGTMQDLLVAKRILEALDRKEESLEDFPEMQKKFLMH